MAERYLGQSWQTTVAGVVIILGAIYLYIHSRSQEETVMAGTIALGGLGLIKAKDSDK